MFLKQDNTTDSIFMIGLENMLFSFVCSVVVIALWSEATVHPLNLALYIQTWIGPQSIRTQKVNKLTHAGGLD